MSALPRRYEYRRARLFEQMELCAVARTCTYIPILSPDGKLGGLESLAVKASTDMWAAAKALYSDVAEEKGALYKPSKMLQPSPDLFFPMGPHRYTASQQVLAPLNLPPSHPPYAPPFHSCTTAVVVVRPGAPSPPGLFLFFLCAKERPLGTPQNDCATAVALQTAIAPRPTAISYCPNMTECMVTQLQYFLGGG